MPSGLSPNVPAQANAGSNAMSGNNRSNRLATAGNATFDQPVPLVVRGKGRVGSADHRATIVGLPGVEIGPSRFPNQHPARPAREVANRLAGHGIGAVQRAGIVGPDSAASRIRLHKRSAAPALFRRSSSGERLRPLRRSPRLPFWQSSAARALGHASAVFGSIDRDRFVRRPSSEWRRGPECCKSARARPRRAVRPRNRGAAGTHTRGADRPTCQKWLAK